MMYRRFLMILALLTATSACSGYKFRCWWGCSDQTAIQNDYIAERNRCREYAQLKLTMSSRAAGDVENEQSYKAKLVNLFNECMANNGWGIVETKSDKAASTTKPASSKETTAEAQQAAVEQKAALSRQAECAFARQAASVSSLAAIRAKACDLECEQKLRLAPDAPRPAACPAEPVTVIPDDVDRVRP